MTTGYSLPDPGDVDDLEELRAAFEWQLPSTYNIAEGVAAWANEQPDRTALYHADEAGIDHEFSYADIDEASKVVAATLRSDGVSRTDRVALCLPPSPEALVLHLAAYRIGAITVPLSVLLGDETVEHVLSTTEPMVVWLDTVAADRFEDVLDRVGADIRPIELGVSDYRKGGALGGLAGSTDGTSVESLARTTPDEPAIVVNTSGSSGPPKCVVQGHRYLIGTLPGYQLWFELFGDSHGERVWTPSSWAWAGALFDVVFPTLAMGGTVCSRVRRSGFEPENALEYLERAHVSRAFVPPTALRKIRRATDPAAFDLVLEVMLCGGEFLPEPLEAWAEQAFNVRINVSYGLTEANALIGHCGAIYPDRADSIGVPYPGHEITIVDENGEPVGVEETGEIALELPDPVAFLGYWADGSIRDPPAGDRFHTGDLGFRDEEGYVFYERRIDNVILSSGYRINPHEIETLLEGHENVREAAVGGLPDDEYGQRIVAYIVLADGSRIDRLELKERVRDRLGKYKAPHEIEVRQDLPQTHSGKVDRQTLFYQ